MRTRDKTKETRATEKIKLAPPPTPPAAAAFLFSYPPFARSHTQLWRRKSVAGEHLIHYLSRASLLLLLLISRHAARAITFTAAAFMAAAAAVAIIGVKAATLV